MKTHLLKIDMIGGEKRDVWWLSQPNIAKNSTKTHRLKHRHDRRRKKRHVVVTCSMQIYIKLFKKTHWLKHACRQNYEEKEICGGYSHAAYNYGLTVA